MKGIRTIALFIFLMGISTFTQAQSIDWIRQFGTPQQDRMQGLAVDTSGIYVTGWQMVPGENPYFVDAVVNKFDSAGSNLWARQFGASGFADEARRIAINATGVY